MRLPWRDPFCPLPGSLPEVRIPTVPGIAYEPAYQEALDYIYSFIDYSLKKNFQFSPEKFNLARMRSFLTYLGEPHQQYPLIHIAGTKGKGSVAAMCSSALQAAGYRVGLYTSPHLHDYTERIQVNGCPIPHAEVVALVKEIKPYLDRGTELTTFEITTALAFLHFAGQGADAVVAEVGLGGRLDATNVITPIVSVITSISLDHTGVLGETLAAIAAEKAGIIKPNIPVVLSPQKDEARQVIERIATERTAPIIQVGEDYRFAPKPAPFHQGIPKNQSLFVWQATEQNLMETYLQTGEQGEWLPAELTIPLLGHHQVENAATAYAALQVAGANGMELDNNAIVEGFASVEWPGRFEILSQRPPVIIDCAHNRDSAHQLRLTLDEYCPDLPIILVFGASEDKDIEGMLTMLAPRVKKMITTRANHPRAIQPDLLAELASQSGISASVYPAVSDALIEALRLANNEKLTQAVLVAGSIFVAAEARFTWYNQLANENPPSGA